MATRKVPRKSFHEVWVDKDMDTHYKASKNLLVNAVNLVHPDTSAHLGLSCDASKKAVEGILEQLVKGHWEPIGFFSNPVLCGLSAPNLSFPEALEFLS